MTKIGCNEARLHLSQLLDRVAKGESITITRYGIPVAMLVPPAARSADEAIEQLRQFGKGRRLDNLSIRDMIAEGRRF